MSTANAHAAARVLGWGSLAFATAGLAAPRLLGRALGYGGRTALVRALGTRDLVIGLGLLAADRPAPWLRARFGAEVFDALLHGVGSFSGSFGRKRALAISVGAAAIACVEYALLADAEDE